MAYSIPILEYTEGCVYKLWYKERFIVIKCKTLARSTANILNGLKYFLLGTPKGRKEEDYFHDFFTYVQSNPFENFSIEVILKSNNPLELLKTEFFELSKSKYDPRCLNNDFDVYIPKFTQVNGKKSWINRGYYLNFMQWKQKQLNQNMIE